MKWGDYMLTTPLGKLIIEKNGKQIDYCIKPQPLKVNEKSNYYVDGRYLITIDTESIKSGDIVKCFIDCKDTETDVDGGEYLALLNFRKDNLLVSLGGYELLSHYYNNKIFGFDIYYIENGLEAYFIDTKYIETFKFAISWMEIKEGRDEIATWYASDPDLCE